MQIVTDVVHMINDFAVWPVGVTNATSSRSVFLVGVSVQAHTITTVNMHIQPSVLWSQYASLCI